MKNLDLQNEIIIRDMEEVYRAPNINWSIISNATFYISGAAGMLASYFVFYLIYLNEIHGYSIKIYANIRNKDKAYNRYGELLNKPYFQLVAENSLINDIKDVNYIIHAASLASPQYFGKMPVETLIPNVVGTYELLEAARKMDCFKGFLFFSSGSVYGNVGAIAEGISEEVQGTLNFLDNGNSYAEGKRCGEALCHAYASEYNVRTLSVRIHHSYGPTMDIENDKRAFSEFVRNVTEGKNIVLKSNGRAKRAFCYLTDAIKGLFTTLLYGNSGEVYNMGNPLQYYEIGEIAEKLVKLSQNEKIKVVCEERRDEGYKLSPESNSRVVPTNIDKLKSLGWSPTVGIEEGFLRVIEYFKVD